MNRKSVLFAFIIILTITSGVLAFNVRKLNGTLFCTTVQGGYCDDTRYKPDPSGDLMYCSTKKDGCMDVTTTTRVVQDPR